MCNIIVIDETLREGMQFRGLVFSRDERLKILEFQEKLGIDICQAGYPPAHVSEADHVVSLHEHAVRQGYHIQVAGLCRAMSCDISPMVLAGLKQIHIHLNLNEESFIQSDINVIFRFLENVIGSKEFTGRDPALHVSLLDIGKTNLQILKQSCNYLSSSLNIPMISLPDTSGLLTPDSVYGTFREITDVIDQSRTRLSTHNHNDMGMASANTVMGVAAGASCIEVSALGIGERNGIGDLYTVCRLLGEKGYDLAVKTEDINTFREYYQYVDSINFKQTGEYLMNYSTPFWGQGARTHVAGTHGTIQYGIDKSSRYTLNVLCGRHLVKKYLDHAELIYQSDDLRLITDEIKHKSARLNRALHDYEITDLLKKIKK